MELYWCRCLINTLLFLLGACDKYLMYAIGTSFSGVKGEQCT